MRIFQTFLAWSCAIFFTVLAVTAIILFNIEQRAFSADTFKQAFDERGLYVRMPAILAETVYESIDQNANADPFLKVLTVDEWQVGLSSLLPPEDLKLLSDQALDSLFAWLNNEADSVSISLLPIKNRLAGPQGMEVVNRLINAQPDCTLDQLLQMGLGFISGNILLCKPPENMMDLITPSIQSQLQVLTAAIPDNVTLISAANAQVDPRQRLNRIRTVMKFSALLPAILLFMLTILIVRSLADWLKWWGYPFLVTGALAVVAGWIGSPMLGFVIQRVLQRQGDRFIPQILIPLLGETVSAVAGQVLQPVIIQGAVLAMLGLGMVISSLVIKTRH